MRQSLEAYCKQVGSLDLLREWDAAGNAPLTLPMSATAAKRRCGGGARTATAGRRS